MHIGITYYPESDGAQTTTGDLYIVKNRMMKDEDRTGGYTSDARVNKIEPHLTEQEVMGNVSKIEAPPASFEQVWGKLSNEDLGSFCCCDCVHYNCCNVGPKWPHGSFANFMYMSPMWLSSLARLAYEASGAAVERVKVEKGKTTWEQHLHTQKTTSTDRRRSEYGIWGQQSKLSLKQMRQRSQKQTAGRV